MFAKRVLAVWIGVLVICLGATVLQAQSLTPEQALGKMIFFDTNLSQPGGQSCGTCHQPGSAFSDPDGSLPVSFGVIGDRTGMRNTPPASYAVFSPAFHFDDAEGLYIGGQFWDGRASTLADQAKGPFLNPLEMNNTKAGVIGAIRTSTYANAFKAVYGAASLDDVDSAYDKMANAIAAYEASSELNSFTSKYDYYLKGQVALTARETRGLELFTNEMKGNCAACHPIETPEGSPGPLFTDFSYDNIGIPRNLNIPAYEDDPTLQDLGLGVTVGDAAENGKFKVSSLRNVAVTGPWGHNGFFTDLEDVVQFYNRRDVTPGLWGLPEVPENVNTSELGNLGLTDEEVMDIVYFLHTLNDGYTVPEPCTLGLLALGAMGVFCRRRCRQ